MSRISKRKYFILLILSTILVEIIFISLIFGGQAEIWMERVGSTSNAALVGQRIKIRVNMDSRAEKITGVAFYLTFDPKVFKVVLRHEGGRYYPFTEGSFLSVSSEDAVFNNTHGDSVNLDPMHNHIENFQLDYYQSTGTVIDGKQPYAQGIGDIAEFDLDVIGFSPNEYTVITFDRAQADNRETMYFELGKVGQEQQFASMPNLKFFTAGFRIYPAVPDTLIIPGDSIKYDLKNHIESSSDTLEYNWSYSIVDTSGNLSIKDSTSRNVEIILDEDDNLSVKSDTSAHGILILNLEAKQLETSYDRNQNVKIGINDSPDFITPLPIIVFNEDDSVTISKADLYSDPDETLKTVNFYLSSNEVFVKNKNDSLTFFAIKDWNGQVVVPCYIQDEVMALFYTKVESEIEIKVNPVNDPPVLDLSSIDPTTVYRGEPKSIPMIVGTHVIDVDDVNFTWDAVSSDTLKLDASFQGSTLELEAVDTTFTGDVSVTITVYDTEDSSDTEQLTVQIKERPTLPPEILDLPIIYKEPETNYVLNLNDHVQDEDTPKSSLNWTFQVTDPTTAEPDIAVVLNYNHDLQTLSISSIPKHHVVDNLTATVYDDFSNSDTETTRLLIFGRNAPLITPLPEIVMVTDTVMNAVDLDTMVYDLNDIPENITWTVGDVDSLESVTIIDTTRELQIQSNDSFIGVDTIFIVATNTSSGSDTAYMRVRVVPRTPDPILIQFPDATYFWRESQPQLYVDLDDHVWDLVTPDSLIDWQIDYNSEHFDLIVDSNNVVRIMTNLWTGQEQVTFTATDEDDNSSETTAIFSIVEDNAPVWVTLEDVSLSKTAELTLYNLATKVSDDRTASTDLIFSYDTESPSPLNIELSPEVKISLSDTTFLGTTWIRFSATDAHGHTAWSNQVTVFTGKSLRPAWKQIPTVQFENNDIYRDLYLRKYCKDPEGQDLVFASMNAFPQQLSVQIVESSSQVYLGAIRGFFGKVDVVFKAIDPDSNVVATVVDVIITDTDPPEGNLTYHINPVIPRRMNFLVMSDATATTFDYTFQVNNRNENLDFQMLDSDSFQKLWATTYKLMEPGNYSLLIKLANYAGLVNRDSLNWTYRSGGFGKKSIISQDQRVTVTLTNNQNTYLNNIILMESYKNDSLLLKKQDFPVYSINVDNKNHDSYIVTYNRKLSDNPYYSFYEITEKDLKRLDTFMDKQGHFQAVIKNHTNFIFMESEVAAHAYSIPAKELLCYPNPFNNDIQIKFFMINRNDIDIIIYNILGQVVFTRKILDSKAGLQVINWNGRSTNDAILPSGIYFIRVLAGNKPELIKKVTMLK